MVSYCYGAVTEGVGKLMRWGHYASKTSILINGEMVIFRLLTKADAEPFRNFFLELPPHEVENLRDDVHSEETVSSWIDSLDYSKVLPLVAWNEESSAIVAVSTLHFSKGVCRHIADVRIVVGKNYRRLGLGSAIIKELVELGNRRGLYFLRAEILTDSRLAIKAFRQLGFEYKCTIEDGFMTRSGETRDVALLLKRLRVNEQEEMFFEF